MYTRTNITLNSINRSLKCLRDILEVQRVNLVNVHSTYMIQLYSRHKIFFFYVLIANGTFQLQCEVIYLFLLLISKTLK